MPSDLTTAPPPLLAGDRPPACRDEPAREARRLFEEAVRLDWRSHDPHDLLLAPALRSLPHRSALLARVAVQAGRRTGAAPRRLLRITPHEEAKSAADFLSAASLLAADGANWARPLVAPLVERLLRHALRTGQGLGWGFGFPYVNRFVNVPARTPNIYVTLCAVRGLLDAGECAGAAGALDAADNGLHFIVEGLGAFETAAGRWLRYWPGSDDCIVNVQATSAALLARTAARRGNDAWTAFADGAIATAIAAQRPNGSWGYSADGKGDFVDSFHTGFVLEGLRDYRAARGAGGVPVDGALRTGFACFKRNLLSTHEQPLGFAGGRPTADGQTIAQAMQTLIRCGDGEEDLALALRIWHNLRRARRRGRSGPPSWWLAWLPRTYPALRWEIAPAMLATAHLALATDAAPSAGE